MRTRNTLDQLIAMKKEIIDSCIAKERKHKEGAKLLKRHPKAFSRLVKRYKEEGVDALIPKKPEPKKFSPDNRTPEWIEEKIEQLALGNLSDGPQALADKLEDEEGIRLHQTTVWGILKCRKVRYTHKYKRWKEDPKLYCLELPGAELQLDVCYPYDRSRKIVSFDAIDNCSRSVFGEMYDTENTDNAIAFVK